MEDTTQSNGGTQWTNQSVEERGKLMRSLVERGLQMYQVFGVPEGKSKEAMEEIRKGSEEHGFVPAEGDEALWAWRKDTKEFQRSEQKQITMDVWMSAWPGKAEGGVIESKRVEAWTGGRGRREQDAAAQSDGPAADRECVRGLPVWSGGENGVRDR